MGVNDARLPAGGPSLPATQRARELALDRSLAALSYKGEPESQITIGSLTRTLWEWRWLVLSVLAAGIAAAVIVTLVTRPQYRASVTMELNPPQVQPLEDNQGGERPVYDDDFLATQYGLLESRDLAQRVVQDLNLASNEEFVPGEDLSRVERREIAIGKVMKAIKVKPVPQSRLVDVTFDAEDPQFAAKAANGVADAFINTSLERRYQSSAYARNFLQRQIATVKRELETSERQLVAYAQAQGLINIASNAGTGTQSGGGDNSSLAGASLVSLNEALTQAQARRFAAEQRYREAGASGVTTDVTAGTSALRNERATLQAEYEQKRGTYQPDFPEMVALKRRIDELTRAITQEGAEVRAGRSGSLRADYLAALAEENKLQARVNQLRGQVLNLRGRNIRYTILQRDVDTNRTLYDALLQRYKQVGVASGIGNSIASIADRAVPPTAPFKPNLFVNLLVGIFLGLLAGVGLALLLDYFNDTIRTPDDIRDKLKLAFIGGIPNAPKDTRPAKELEDTGSPISEAYFSAVTALEFATDNGAPRTLLVTSTGPSEGKSTSAWALARSFGRLGRRVLLIDADLRKPAFRLAVDDSKGLSVLLSHNGTIQDHVIPVEEDNLYVISSGPLPPNPAELLASQRFAAILEEALQHFDQVVVDGPPVIGLADSPLLSTMVDGTLVIVQAGKTRTRAAIEAQNRMRAAGAALIGAILTRYKPQVGYGYGYGYSENQYRYRMGENQARIIRLTARDDG